MRLSPSSAAALWRSGATMWRCGWRPLTEEEVREVYPQPVRKTVQATRDMEDMIGKYRQLCNIQQETEKVRRVLRDGILRGMGDAAALTDANGVTLATFRPNSAGVRIFRLAAPGGEAR